MPSEFTFGSMLSRALRWSSTLGMHPHFKGIPDASRVVYRRNARPVRRHPACPEGCVPPESALTLWLSRALRGSRTHGMRPHSEDIPHDPRVAYPRNAPRTQGYSTCSEGRVPFECILTLRLSRALRGSCTPGAHVRFEAILHAPRVADPRDAFSL